MSALAARTAGARALVSRSTLMRSLGLVVFGAVVLLIVTDLLSDYRNLQLANGAYYFCALAGLTVLAGLSGQVSLGHGALMAVGAYTVALLIGNEGWALVPALVAAAVVTAIVGIPVGAAASRLRGPYLAGATLAFAVGLPALADRFPSTFGGENGLVINPPTPPSALGSNFSLEHWEAWIACAGALVVLFVLYNLVHSGLGRSLRAVRDDEIAAALCGLRIGRTQTLAFAVSAGCAGLGGGLLTIVLQLASPGAFQLQLSLFLLAGVVIGGLGSLAGAIWGAALLVLLPNWTNDIANSFSLSTKVSANLPLAIYGVVLIGAMLVWPSGIHGGVRAIGGRVRRMRRPGGAPAATAASDVSAAATAPADSGVAATTTSAAPNVPPDAAPAEVEAPAKRT
jgi:branched-chain amino acid transport system permease protein